MTSRETVVRARIGQGKFRQYLIEYWKQCAVTGCQEIDLLRASYIKPWAESSLIERMSLYNGLLLSPTIDAAFDSGYISFDDEGRMLISSRLSPDDATVLGIKSDMKLSKIEDEHRTYLHYHRENVFK